MEIIDRFQRHGARVSLGELDDAQKDLLYEALLELGEDRTLEDNRSLVFLAPLYAQAVMRQQEGAIGRLEALAMQLEPKASIKKTSRKKEKF